MKRFLTATAIVALTAASPALAQDSNIRNSVEVFLTASTFDVEVDTLTDAQVAKIYGAMTASESSSEQIAAVRAVLAEENVLGMQETAVVVGDDSDVAALDGPVLVISGAEYPRSQVYLQVEQGLVGTMYTGRADELSDDELVEAFTAISSTDSVSERNDKLRAVFN